MPMRSSAKDLGIIKRRRFDMANFEQVQKNLEARRYKVKVFASAA